MPQTNVEHDTLQSSQLPRTFSWKTISRTKDSDWCKIFFAFKQTRLRQAEAVEMKKQNFKIVYSCKLQNNKERKLQDPNKSCSHASRFSAWLQTKRFKCIYKDPDTTWKSERLGNEKGDNWKSKERKDRLADSLKPWRKCIAQKLKCKKKKQRTMSTKHKSYNKSNAANI